MVREAPDDDTRSALTRRTALGIGLVFDFTGGLTMLCRKRTTKLGLSLLVLAMAAGCGSDDDDTTPGTGGATGSGGAAGKPGSGGSSGGSGGISGGSGGATGSGGSGSGGSAASGGSGGATVDAGSGGSPGGDASAGETGSAPVGGMGGPINFGGVLQVIPVPLQYTASPVPPIIAPACPEDLTAGFTEYQDSFVVQRPRDLPASDRIKYENGIYTFWVESGDLSHKADSGTEPRTEARYSDISTGEHIWSGDVMFESPSKTCIFQIHNVNSPIAIYLRVVGDRMFNLSTGTTIATGQTGKWFNLKVAFNTQTREVRTYINNCLKETSRAPATASVNKWYFKHGVYTCDSGTCRSSYKNIHLFHKGSTDTFNVKSTYP
jgi:hypothetical protein